MSKTSWLILSVALNAILAGLIIQTYVGRSAPASTNNALPAARTPSASTRHDALPDFDSDRLPSRSASQDAGTSQSPALSPLAHGFSKDQIADVARRLRAAGFSDAQVADLVAAMFDRQWRDRWQDLSQRFRRGELDPRQRNAQYMEYMKEREAGMRAALGDAAYTTWDKQQVLDRFDVQELRLSPEQQDALYRIEKGRQASDRDLSIAFQAGQVDQIDFQDQRTASQKDYDQQLEQLLGKQGALQIKEDNDWTFGQTRWDLRSLNLTDSQVDALYAALQQNNEKQQDLQRQSRSGTPIDANKWQELQAAKDQAIQQAIGDAGFAQYQKTQDNGYRQMQQFATAWQLSGGDIDHVYQVLKDNAQSAKDFRQQAQADQAAGQKVDWNQINQGIANLKMQVDADLHSYLGDDRYQKLKRAGIIQLNY